MNQVRYVLLAVTLVALVGVSALALDVPNTFASGEVISAAEMNANFAAVEAAVTSLQTSQPVVAHGRSALSNNAVTAMAEAEDVVTVTLEAPAAGVVLVQATAQVGLYGTALSNYVGFRIDDAPGGQLDGEGPHDFLAGFFAPPSEDLVWLPVAIQRAFEVAAGPQTYRLEAVDRTGSGTKYFWNPTITATWYPADRADVQVPIMVLDGVGGGNLP